MPAALSRALAAAILERGDAAILTVDMENNVTAWTESAARFFGRAARDVVGHHVGGVLPFITEGSSERGFLATIAKGGRWRGEGAVRMPDGRELWVESTVSRLTLPDGSAVGLAIVRDMSERHAQALAHQAAERALRALSAFNRELVRASGEQDLLGEACRILVEVGGYLLAWVGYARDDAARTVEPVASAGHDAGYTGLARITWAEGPRGGGPSGVAIRSAAPDVLRDPADPRFAPWLVEARERGFAATAALPLLEGGRAVGALNLYADRPDAFGDAELELLEELAGDLAYGVAARRAQAAHRQAVEALRVSEERYRTVANALAEGVVVHDPAGRAVAANPAARAILGWRRSASADSLRWPDLVREDGTPLAPRDHPAAVTLRTGRAQRNVVLGLRRTTGELRWIAMHTDPLAAEGGTGVVASFEDVTLHRRARADALLAASARAALLEAVQGISPEASLEAAAQTICDQLSSLRAVDFVAVGLSLAGDDLRIVASAGPPGFSAMRDRPFPTAAAQYLRERAMQGPWAEYAAALAGETGVGDVLPPAVSAIAVGPIVHGGHVDGILIMGTRDPEFAPILVSRMPAVDAFSATSSGLLAERMHALRDEVERHARIERLIADRAFRSVFQPIVDLEAGEIVAYEALTRFDAGQQPERCFADAWSAGLGPELELATLDLAVEASARLPAGLWLHLNVSPRLALETDRLAAILRDAGRPIVLEVTEHDAVADYEALRNAVRALGRDVRLAIDDAGAGVANFGHIIELHPDFVKLDQSLVGRVNAHLGRQALVVAMRHFARTAGCRLVAEGIETDLEAAALRELGVEFGQGYLFGHPESAAVWAAHRGRGSLSSLPASAPFEPGGVPPAGA